jgi:hypothetical protein
VDRRVILRASFAAIDLAGRTALLPTRHELLRTLRCAAGRRELCQRLFKVAAAQGSQLPTVATVKRGNTGQTTFRTLVSTSSEGRYPVEMLWL